MAAAFWLHWSLFPCTGDSSWGCWLGAQGGLSEVCVPGRTERATAVLLADPCFQLRSIQYLLGHAEPSALAAAAPATDKRHFSLHSCECCHCTGSWAVEGGMGLLVSSVFPATCPSPFSTGDGCLCSIPHFGWGYMQ